MHKSANVQNLIYQIINNLSISVSKSKIDFKQDPVSMFPTFRSLTKF